MKKQAEGNKIILASKSPRRKAILNQIGVGFVSIESTFREKKDVISPTPSKVRQLVIKNAKEKAVDVADRIKEGVVLGVDTLVLFDNKIIGKPKDKEDTVKTLKILNGKMHLVFSGVALLKKDKRKVTLLTGSEVTKVYFRKLSNEEIKEYIETGEPLDKAGGYGIQERGARLIERIDGDFYNVVGLPLVKFLELARRMKIKL